MPGAYELPLAARYLAGTGRVAGVACLGAVIRGETSHYDHVCTEAAAGIARVALRHRRALRLRGADRGDHGAGAGAGGRGQAPPGRGRRARGAAHGRPPRRAVRVSAPAQVNLLSDTQTRPTEAMRAAIAAAEVGDEQKGLDPTTIELQERVAALLGHEAGLFLPSGSMCNLIAFRLHIRPGGRRDASWPPTRTPPGSRRARRRRSTGPCSGSLDAPDGDLLARTRCGARCAPPATATRPRSRMVSVEQSTNLGGGPGVAPGRGPGSARGGRRSRPARPPGRRPAHERRGGVGRARRGLGRRLRHRLAGLLQGPGRAGGRGAGGRRRARSPRRGATSRCWAARCASPGS